MSATHDPIRGATWAANTSGNGGFFGHRASGAELFPAVTTGCLQVIGKYDHGH